MNHQLDRNRRRLLKLMGSAGLALKAPWVTAGMTPSAFNTKPIPSSGEQLPVIGLGTSRVFNVGEDADELPALREVIRILAMVDNSMVDSSPMYGEAERVTGELVEAMNVRDKLFFATKVWTRGREEGIVQMQDSLRLLRTRCIDLMQIHNLVDWQTHIKTLREWKERGSIRYLGITHYDESAHDEVIRVMRQTPLDFLQINYSIAEPEAAAKILPLAREKGIAVIANRPFARGGLFRASRGKALPAWAAEIDCTSWAQFFLKFVVSHPAVTCAIPATSKAKHMLDNQAAGLGRMPGAGMREAMQSLVRDF
jgi:diketogulonate reductase-like aldo/keto reductase